MRVMREILGIRACVLQPIRPECIDRVEMDHRGWRIPFFAEHT